MGAEGPTEDPGIQHMRERQVRNFLTTLLFSQGVPMIAGGDEIARAQSGNNNGYCQENELTWYDWNLDERRNKLLKFTTNLVALRRSHPNLHRRNVFQDRTIRNSVVRDIACYSTDGNEMPEETWTTAWVCSVGLMLNGKTLQISDEEGRPIEDDSFLLLVNASHEDIEFTLPSPPNGSPWMQLLNTENIDDHFEENKASEKVIVGGRTMMIFYDRCTSNPEKQSKP